MGPSYQHFSCISCISWFLLFEFSARSTNSVSTGNGTSLLLPRWWSLEHAGKELAVDGPGIPDLHRPTIAVLSKLPVTIRDPSARNDAEKTGPECPLQVRSSVFASHTFVVVSSLPVMIRESSELKDAALIPRVCPLRVRSPAPVVAFHTFAVLS